MSNRVRQRTAYALTYNISWATQKNIVAGSEADFVRACQNAKRDCWKTALRMLSSLRETIDVAGFQEVDAPDASTRLRAMMPTLDSEYHAVVWIAEKQHPVRCLLMWNSRIFGTAIWSSTVELDLVLGGRPMGIVVTETTLHEYYLLIVAHFPWTSTTVELRAIEGIIASHVPDSLLKGRSVMPIVMADTNDANTLLSDERPLRIGNRMRVSQGATRATLRRKLKTCCWHEEGHKYGHFTDTGDYVLSTHVKQQYVPKLFSDARDEPLASDHLPVVAKLALPAH